MIVQLYAKCACATSPPSYYRPLLLERHVASPADGELVIVGGQVVQPDLAWQYVLRHPDFVQQFGRIRNLGLVYFVCNQLLVDLVRLKEKA